VSALPRQIANFAVTYRCDGRCTTCNIWKSPPGEELTLDEIRGFFQENRGLFREVESIQLTGGEPFLRDDLPEIIEAIDDCINGCTFWVPTNGLSPELILESTERALAKLRKGIMGVSVSIDGLEETHDMQRGIKGGYVLAQETLRKLSDLRKTEPKMMLSVGMTLTPMNLKEAPIVQRDAYERGADFSLRPLNVSDIYYRNDGFGTVYDKETLYKTLRAVAKNALDQHGLLRSLTTLRYLRGVQEYIETEARRTTPCHACTESFFLDPYGDVYPCIVMNSRLGNIREKPFSEIWASEKAEETRTRISELECPRCWVECEAYREIGRNLPEKLRMVITAVLDKRNLGLKPYPSLLMM
jgi:MoaA/NifB/PqqE/SkfB family radical SAM enzyme